ncbi:SUMO-specific isopeptidase USPL1 like protein [Argiope bruennichi]|uniref:SUMO-specific isopeptidase USPL1 like protein n=1 Tax=Argiope bruennichi TaxID=94029 RepID=A0A8T0F206_ARGBR|nr:SUMO-specific isopeptidase USPL1 like protein [Argiope bruennichi]
MQKANDILQGIQDIVLKYLKPTMKWEEGLPDSAFCSLLNLINENKEVKNLFLVDYFCIGRCTNCAHTHTKNWKKTIITLSEVKEFNPDSPACLYKCPNCKSSCQMLGIKYNTLPQCLIFHFENGVKEGDLQQCQYTINNREYKLSGLIVFKKGGINHFVTWIRDAVSGSWLECDDLKRKSVSFSRVPPTIELQDLYIVVYEALDNKGTALLSASADTANNNNIDYTSSSCIPIIDISDEEDFEQNYKTEKSPSDLNVMRSVISHDHDYCINNNYKILIRPDEIEDHISVTPSALESQDSNVLMEESNIMKEPINAEEDEESCARASGCPTFTLNKMNASPLQTDVFSKSINNNSKHDDRNRFKDSTLENIKQSLLIDSIVVHKRDDIKSFAFPISEIASFAKPVLENYVKTSKENSGKTLVGTTSSIEILEIQSNTKDNSFGKKDIPSAFAENFLGKDHNISSKKDFSFAFEIEDKRGTKNPVASQDSNVLMEESKKMKEPINAEEDEESCARASGCPTFTLNKMNASPLQTDVFSKSINNNSKHDDRNRFKDSTLENIKQSLLIDSIVVHKRDDIKSFAFPISEIASFAKPVLENYVKTSKENSGKTLVGTTSSIEILEIQSNTKDNSFGKKDIPSAFAENFLGKDHNISSKKDFSFAFEIEDKRGTKNPVASQDSNVLMEESKKMKEPIKAVEDCARESGCPKELTEQFVFKQKDHKRPRKIKKICSICNE